MHAPSPRQLKRLASLFSVLGDPARLRILHCLREGPRSVGEIHRVCRLKQANTSKHLRVLREARVVSPRRSGTTVYYEISEPLVPELCDLVCGTATFTPSPRQPPSPRATHGSIRSPRRKYTRKPGSIPE